MYFLQDATHTPTPCLQQFVSSCPTGPLPCGRITFNLPYSSSRSSSHGRDPIQCFFLFFLFFRDLMFIQIESTRFRSSQRRQGYSNTAAVQNHPGKNAPTDNQQNKSLGQPGPTCTTFTLILLFVHMPARVQTPLTLVLRCSLSLSPSPDPSPIMCCIKLM